MPIDDAQARAWSYTAVSLDQLAVTDGVRIIRGNATMEQLLESPRKREVKNEHGLVRWVDEDPVEPNPRSRRPKAEVPLTVAEVQAIIEIKEAALGCFRDGLFEEPSTRTEHAYSWYIERQTEGLKDTLQGWERQGDTSRSFFDRREGDIKFLKDVGGPHLLDRGTKTSAPFRSLMLHDAVGSNILSYVKTVSLIMLQICDKTTFGLPHVLFSPFIYRGSFDNLFAETSALTRAKLVVKCRQYITAYSSNSLIRRHLPPMIWDAVERHFKVQMPNGTFLRFGDRAFQEAERRAGTYQTFQQTPQQPHPGSSTLHSLTKLSRRQEDRTGVSERDLRERYGLE